ncbi:hypothetical protein PHET_00177 [Paragonimus heterotremus]|uniref:C2H2-type domain-containing protein n=1 Tax=Paragonimus heterotremus TaxID=100268 RepID=A0A8J4TNL0_9TREM|nr:hypothetical protein PHET_00177 [Paragonimus heterotremus]
MQLTVAAWPVSKSVLNVVPPTEPVRVGACGQAEVVNEPPNPDAYACSSGELNFFEVLLNSMNSSSDTFAELSTKLELELLLANKLYAAETLPFLNGNLSDTKATDMSSIGDLQQMSLDPAALSLVSRLFPGMTSIYQPFTKTESLYGESKTTRSDMSNPINTSSSKPKSTLESDITSNIDNITCGANPFTTLLPFTSAVYNFGFQTPLNSVLTQPTTSRESVTTTTTTVPDLSDQFLFGTMGPLTEGQANVTKDVSAPTDSLPTNQAIDSVEDIPNSMVISGKKANSVNQIANLLNVANFTPLPFATVNAEYAGVKLKANPVYPGSTPTQFSTQSPSAKSDEDFCEMCQKHFCNKYYLRKHKADVHGIHTEPYSHSRRRDCGVHAGSHCYQSTPAGNLEINLQRLQNNMIGEELNCRNTNEGIFSGTEDANDQDELQRVGMMQTASVESSEQAESCRNANKNSGNNGSTVNNPNAIMPQKDSIPHELAQIRSAPPYVIMNPAANGCVPLNPLNGLDPMLSAHYYMMALASSMPSTVTRSSLMFPSIMSGQVTTNTDKCNPLSIDMPLLPVTGLDGNPGIHEVQCELCQKVFCSQYFLHVHKLNQHPSDLDNELKTDGSSPPVDKSDSYLNASKLSKTDHFNFALMDSVANLECELPSERFTGSSTIQINERYQMSETEPNRTKSVRNENNLTTEMKASVTSLDAFKSSMVAAKLADRVTCELCKKELCNKYFLRTHKIRVHGVSPKDVGGPPMRNPPVLNQPPVTTTVNTVNSSSVHFPFFNSMSSITQSGMILPANTGHQLLNYSPSDLLTSFHFNPLAHLNPLLTLPYGPGKLEAPESDTSITTSLSGSFSVPNPAVPLLQASSNIPTTLCAESMSKTWPNLFPSPGLSLSNMNVHDVYSAASIICCPICDQPIGPRLYLPSHLRDTHGLNPTNPIFFLNMLRAKCVSFPKFSVPESSQNSTPPGLNSSPEVTEMTVSREPILSCQSQNDTMLYEGSINGSVTGSGDMSISPAQNTVSPRMSLSSCTEMDSIIHLASSTGTLCESTKPNERSSSLPQPTVFNMRRPEHDYSISQGSPKSQDSQCTQSYTDVTKVPGTFSISPNTFPASITFTDLSVPILPVTSLVNSTPNVMTSENERESIFHPPCLSGFGPPVSNCPMGSSIAAAALSTYPNHNVDVVTAAALANSQWNNPLHQLANPVLSKGTPGIPNSSTILFTTSPNASNLLSSGSGMPRKSPNQMRVLCDICNKWICNKYFLRTHKANKHGITDVMQNSLETGRSNLLRSNLHPHSPLHTPYRRGLPTIAESLDGLPKETSDFLVPTESTNSNAPSISGGDMMSYKTSYLPIKPETIDYKSEANLTTLESLTQAWKMSYDQSAHTTQACAPFVTRFPIALPPFVNPAFALPGLVAPPLLNPFTPIGLPNPNLLPLASNPTAAQSQNMVHSEEAEKKSCSESSSNSRANRVPEISDLGGMEESSNECRLPLNLSLKGLLDKVSSNDSADKIGNFGPQQRSRMTGCFTSQRYQALKCLRRARSVHYNQTGKTRQSEISFETKMNTKSNRSRGATGFRSDDVRVPHRTMKSPKQRHSGSWTSSKMLRSGTQEFDGFSCQPCAPELSPVLKFDNDLTHPNSQAAEHNEVASNMNTNFSCPLCPLTTSNDFTTLNLLLQHLSLTHGNHTSVPLERSVSTTWPPPSSVISSVDSPALKSSWQLPAPPPIAFNISQLATSSQVNDSSSTGDYTPFQSMTSIAMKAADELDKNPESNVDSKFGHEDSEPTSNETCLRDIHIQERLHRPLFIPVNSFAETLSSM